MAINDQGQRGPAAAVRPDTAKVGGPAFAWGRGDKGHSFDAEPHADRALPDLPALDLEDALNLVLVEAEQSGHRAIGKRGFLLDHRLDRLAKRGSTVGADLVIFTLIATFLFVA